MIKMTLLLTKREITESPFQLILSFCLNLVPQPTFSFSFSSFHFLLREVRSACDREREREREREKEMKSRSEEQKGGNRAKKINKRAQKESDIQMRGVDNIEQKRRQKSESEKGTKSRWQ